MISNLLYLGGTYVVLALAWWILQIVANWKIFTKAGQAGWKSIIPIYGDYVSYKIAWQTSYFWLSFILEVVVSCIDTFMNPTGENIACAAIVILINLVLAVISIMYCVKLSRAFGRGIGFAIGLIFLQPIFLLILAFSDSQYYGANK